MHPCRGAGFPLRRSHGQHERPFARRARGRPPLQPAKLADASTPIRIPRFINRQDSQHPAPAVGAFVALGDAVAVR